MNMRAAFTDLMQLLSSTIALGGENPVLGTWKLKSFVRELPGTSEKVNQLGEHPDGYISYSADGRMYTIATSDSRVKPRNGSAPPNCLLGWSLRAFTLINTLCCCPGSKRTSSLAPNLRCVGVRQPVPATTLALGPAGALACIHEVRRHPRKPKGAICELVAGP